MQRRLAHANRRLVVSFAASGSSPCSSSFSSGLALTSFATSAVVVAGASGSQRSQASSRFKAPPKNLSSQIRAVVDEKESKSIDEVARNLAALKPTVNSLDPAAFLALIHASVELKTTEHLDTISEYAQRQGPNMAGAVTADLCRLIRTFPTMPKAHVLVGMLTQKVAHALVEMRPEDIPAVLAVFVTAGPLGEHVAKLAAKRLVETVPASTAATCVDIANIAAKAGPELLGDLPSVLKVRLETLSSELAADPSSISSSLADQTALAVAALCPMFASAGSMQAVSAFVKSRANPTESDAAMHAGLLLDVAEAAQRLSMTRSAATTADLIAAAKEAMTTRFASITLTGFDNKASLVRRANSVWATISGGDAALPNVAAAEQALIDTLVEHNPSKRITAPEVAAMICPAAMEHSDASSKVATVVDAWHEAWTAAEWAPVLAALGQCGADCRAARQVLRNRSAAVVTAIGNASGADLATIAKAVGSLQVRIMALSTAVAERCTVVRDSSDVADLTAILVALTKVDARLPKPLIECVPQIRRHTGACSSADAAALILAYARHNIWLYKVYARLADRLVPMAHEWTWADVRRALAGLHRVGVKHAQFTDKVLDRLIADFDDLSFADAVNLVGAVTKAGAWSPELFKLLGDAALAREGSITADELGDTLMCFARVGFSGTDVYDRLALRAVGLAPTAPPLAIANIVTAYATARVSNTELFTVYGERTLQLKQDLPAVTIAAVLTAFSTVGIQDDRLFIEMIPRVRFVAHHGTPQDVANVLTAYTSVGLWHYKLFVKLAERAIQVRAECTAEQIAQILFAFAKVEMKYDKLYVDFSPRVQVIAATALPSHLAAIAHSYAAVKAYDMGVLNAVAERAVQVVGEFRKEEATMLLRAYRKMASPQVQLFEAFAATFPDLQAAGADGDVAVTDSPSTSGAAPGTAATENAGAAAEPATGESTGSTAEPSSAGEPNEAPAPAAPASDSGAAETADSSASADGGGDADGATPPKRE